MVHGLVNKLGTHFHCEIVLHVSKLKLWNLVKFIARRLVFFLYSGEREVKRETNKPQHQNKYKKKKSFT